MFAGSGEPGSSSVEPPSPNSGAGSGLLPDDIEGNASGSESGVESSDDEDAEAAALAGGPMGVETSAAYRREAGRWEYLLFLE